MNNMFESDVLNLVETQINLSLVSHTFSMMNKMLQGKESALITSINSNELLGMMQQGGLFTCASS